MSMESSPLSAFFSAVSFCTKNWRDSRWSFTFTYSFPQWINEFNTSEVVSQEYMDGFSIRNRVGSSHFLIQMWVRYFSRRMNSPKMLCEVIWMWLVRCGFTLSFCFLISGRVLVLAKLGLGVSVRITLILRISPISSSFAFVMLSPGPGTESQIFQRS